MRLTDEQRQKRIENPNKYRHIAQKRSRETHHQRKIERIRDKLIDAFKELDDCPNFARAEALEELKEVDEEVVSYLMDELEDVKENLQKKDEEIRNLSHLGKPSHLCQK
jgi:hypothetical protein